MFASAVEGEENGALLPGAVEIAVAVIAAVVAVVIVVVLVRVLIRARSGGRSLAVGGKDSLDSP